jgi:hypothetical protein
VTIENHTTNSADRDHKSDFAEASPRLALALRLKPRVQDMRNGTFQPIVVFDDGGESGAIFGDPVATLKEAADLGRSACEAVFPAGVWRDGWLAA